MPSARAAQIFPGTRRRRLPIAVVVAVLCAPLCMAATTAAGVPASSLAQLGPAGLPFGVFGPVGIVAVFIGVSGLLAGLLRRTTTPRRAGAHAAGNRRREHHLAGATPGDSEPITQPIPRVERARYR